VGPEEMPLTARTYSKQPCFNWDSFLWIHMMSLKLGLQNATGPLEGAAEEPPELASLQPLVDA